MVATEPTLRLAYLLQVVRGRLVPGNGSQVNGLLPEFFC